VESSGRKKIYEVILVELPDEGRRPDEGQRESELTPKVKTESDMDD
jgi:hypothetical protein